MVNFIDEAVIEVTSGKGGNGCVSFRREKYIPKGGPNGGDGGKGGAVVFVLKENMRGLGKLRHHRFFKAANGGDGMGNNRHGKDGDDVVITVPPGTKILDEETGEVLHDFDKQTLGERFVFLKGGNGGWGNTHFKSSTNQAPRRANEGEPGEYKKLKLELSIIADVALVGFPNAGKSSLLNAFTAARPKVAPYPFTTKIPHLGVLRVGEDADIVIADIPGLIEGASEGKGLGLKFLKHIERTRALVFMIDASEERALTAYEALCKELENYSSALAAKKRMILCNKIDLEGATERAKLIADKLHALDSNLVVIPTSVLCNKGLGSARNALIELVAKGNASGEASKEALSDN